MTAFFAIVGNTWQQSKQQVVFMLMLAMLALVTALAIFLPKSIAAGEPGGQQQFGLAFVDEPTTFMEDSWWTAWEILEARERNAGVEVKGRRVHVSESRKAEQRRRDGLTHFERSVQGWIYQMEAFVTSIAMLFFLIACAGYFPNFLAAGAVDAVLSKPMSRLQVFAGRYVGGLAFVTIALLVTNALMFAGIGWRTGVWHSQIFAAIPFQICIAATLYAIMALLGMLARGVALPLLVGLLYYVFLDTGLGAAMEFSQLGAFRDYPNVEQALAITRRVVPNFSTMNEAASIATLEIPTMDWEPYIAAGCWTVVTLALAYTLFRRRDF